ncbi:MAG: Uma2 family endonuclease [Planctomycetes bacterium]|nr:Uma2 family endonuclease [Planctomycetota bacterium]
MANLGTTPAELKDLPIPPLEQGDLLTREEFERRYDAMLDLKKAELLEGEVYMPSPVRLRKHAGPHAKLITWLGTYEAHTPGVLAGDNASIRLDVDSEPQPDAVLLVDPDCGGRAKISEDDYVEGAPELVAEIAASSKSIDLHKKFRVYRKNEVLEYIVWRVQDSEVDWFIWKNEEYQKQTPDSDGILKSAAFPGLWLDAPALVRHDLRAVLESLHRGLASAEHVAFAAKLNERSSTT